MAFDSSWIESLGPAQLVAKAILISLAGILSLISFIVCRRWYRGRYFRRLNERTLALCERWNDILSGKIPAATWRTNSFDCKIVEGMLLDTIEMAEPQMLPELLACLRDTGLLDLRIQEARRYTSWRQRAALISLGRARAPEAIPALAEALVSSEEETRIAAVRGLGRTGLLAAAYPLLDSYVAGDLQVPEHTLKNALVHCCQNQPQALIAYMDRCSGTRRELLARVVGELATPELGDDLIVLAADPLPEVRASAARALARLDPKVAFPILSTLASDKEWFVRLRAVIALGHIQHSGKQRTLLRALGDPHRHVRIRAASVLAKMESDLPEIVDCAIAMQDSYALQALLSELDASGALENVANWLERSSDPSFANAALKEITELAKKHTGEKIKVAAAAAGGQ
jgi:HEAT repeat protein